MMAHRNEPTILLQLMANLQLMGKKHREIAEIVGRTRENVTRSLESPDGQDVLTRLRREVHAQVFDPVQEQLDTYAREAMEELWTMRETVESEKLKKDILVDVLHMAGYRPNTNTDSQAEQLPTIIVGQTLNVQQNFGSEETRSALPEELTDATSNGSKQITDRDCTPSAVGSSSRESIGRDEEWKEHNSLEGEDEPRFVSVGRWTSSGSIREQSASSSESTGDEGEKQFEPTFTPEL